jgi:catechol 2,3-dioxygenase-like lactoylglutathione lyase family enzyme
MKIFEGLGHLAFRVRDLDASVAFYDKIGFPEFLRLLNDRGEPWIVYLRITDELYLELLPKGVGDRVPGADRVGLTHLCLTVSDLDGAEAKLTSVGIPLSRPRKAGRGVDRNRGMWIEDPPDCIQYEAIRNLHAGCRPHVLTMY